MPRYKQTAVLRNQVKRRLREIARIYLLPTGIHADIVLRIRPEAYTASFESLTREVQSTIGQLYRWFGATSTSATASDLTPST